MFIQISSGNGIDEVCRALYFFLDWLEGRYSFEIVNIEVAKCKNCYKSVLLRSEDKNFLKLEGTHLWQSQSPFRAKHKRKNWYFSLHIFKEQDSFCFDESKIVYQALNSPKRGGQHVNTTDSGVRAVYKPFNVEAVSFDERSQHLNKKVAKARLLKKLEKLKQSKLENWQHTLYKSSKETQRGQEVLKFVGKTFKMAKN